MQELLGTDTIVTKNGNVSVDTLKGKHIMIYFSAHWCPPCRQFTPILADFYKQHAAAKNFEIIYVSSDRDVAQFNEYYGEHPWAAIPFDNQAAKSHLAKKFNVSGIPALMVLTPEGNLITNNGRGMVMSDRNGEKFPWN